MHNIKFYLSAVGICFLMTATTAWGADINCTKAPDCASLGYTKTATDCPKGGVKCPFDSSKMFCLKNTAAYNFQITQAVNLYDVVYHDGTTSSATSVSGKTPIGIVYYVQTDGSKMHGLIMSLDQPMVGTRQEAIDYCANYVVKGTNVGDWRLPNVTEMLRMGDEYSLGKLNDKVIALQTKLAQIYNADALKGHAHIFYYYAPYWDGQSYRNPKHVDNVTLMNTTSDSSDIYTYEWSNYVSYSEFYVGVMKSPYYWTISEYKSGSTTNYYYVLISEDYSNYVSYTSTKTVNASIRCIMQF